MDFDDLRGFIAAAEGLGELETVRSAHWDLEIGAITELVAEKRGPALLFDEIVDYPKGFRVLSNSFSSFKRTALVLNLPPELSAVQLLDAWRKKIRRISPIPPEEVETGPLVQNVLTGDDVDLFRFPAPRWHEKDGGRYLGTGSAVITRDPEDGQVNVGTYRCMIHNRDTIGVKLNKGKHGRVMMEKYHARGEPCPIAIAFGQDPRLWLAASSALNMPEYEFAGWLREKPVPVIKGPYTGLPLPWTAEIVIEGEIPPLDQIERYQEGPFGEWLGYYADTTEGVVPVMKVKAVFHRNDPIIMGAPPLKPPAPYYFALPLRAAQVWDQLEKAGIPDIRGVWQYAGTWNLFLVIAIKQRYAGHAKQTALAANGIRAGTYAGRFTVVVDDDIDISNPEEVMWAMATRCKADEIDIVRGVWTTPGDPMIEDAERAEEENISSRAIIDACIPYRRLKTFPPVVTFSPEYRDKIKEKWPIAR